MIVIRDEHALAKFICRYVRPFWEYSHWNESVKFLHDVSLIALTLLHLRIPFSSVTLSKRANNILLEAWTSRFGSLTECTSLTRMKTIQTEWNLSTSIQFNLVYNVFQFVRPNKKSKNETINVNQNQFLVLLLNFHHSCNVKIIG